MSKLNQNEFKKICQFLYKCDIYSLSCVCKKFYIWVKKFKLIDHKCYTLTSTKLKVKFGCVGTAISTFNKFTLLKQFAAAGHLYPCRKLIMLHWDLHKISEIAAKNGHLHICKFLSNIIKIDYTKLALEATHAGKLNIVKWIYSRDKDNFKYKQLYDISFMIGNLNICKWIILTCDPNLIHNTDILRFHFAARCGSFNVCKWFVETRSKFVIQDINVLRNAVAARGHLAVYKLLLEIDNTPQNMDHNTFVACAGTGSLEMCKWIKLHNLCIIDYNSAFETALSRGHTAICTWLINEYPVVKRFDNIEKLPDGNLEFYKWLYKVSQKFKVACECNVEFLKKTIGKDLEITKWFFSKLKIEIKIKDIKFMIKVSVSKSCIDTFQWLLSKFNIVNEYVVYKVSLN